MNKINPKVEEYLSKFDKWQAELQQLRMIVLDCGLTEELKWGVPCYTFQDGNVVLIHSFKEYCAIGFFKGVLLKDESGILIQQTENSQTARQIRFTSLDEIIEQELLVKAYLYEAIEAEKAGTKIELKKTDEFNRPEELQRKLDENAAFKTAFEALTPGRQRGYLLHFSEAKQSKTREARIEKYMPQILNGKGFNDCTCGLSKRMPSCDGSHKQLVRN
jgi:uncharacterized protein YdeI (YjbR/CyaY-like superfamily)